MTLAGSYGYFSLPPILYFLHRLSQISPIGTAEINLTIKDLKDSGGGESHFYLISLYLSYVACEEDRWLTERDSWLSRN